MSSSPIEGGMVAPLTVSSVGDVPVVARQQRNWIKRALPRSLFGRSLLIIVTPLILLQVISTWIFYERHWDTVARRLAGGVAGDIAMMAETMDVLDGDDERRILSAAAGLTELEYTFRVGAVLPPAPATVRRKGALTDALEERVRRPFRIDAASDVHRILVAIQLADGVLDVAVPRQRLYSSTTYIFVLWMVGSSMVLFAVATMFMRNQVRALRRLANAAENFGKGRHVANFKLEGATEIRQAAAAFIVMRDRIQRQISQRTEMLAGVSHDLRTPLTRMKLALEFLEDGPTVAELKSDVEQMQGMVRGYLDFARGEGGETPREVDLPMLLEEVVANARRDGAPVSIAAPEAFAISLRPDATKRCIANLIANALRYGSHVWVAAVPVKHGIDILVDDDGPGIPAHRREDVFRPFFRLDAARSPQSGSVGLGLTIARDVALSHGGDISLEDSPQGGLRVRVHLPK
jgi:two-component system, OmpR family, osmolarity sensor histidine kinase EnvZ